jgi:hypothetical protein
MEITGEHDFEEAQKFLTETGGARNEEKTGIRKYKQ